MLRKWFKVRISYNTYKKNNMVEKKYIWTFHTSLSHHIAQILKWQFVLALFVLCLDTNTQRK